MTPHEIHDKYPIRNSVWSFDRMTGRWVTETSDLVENLDPWKRPLTPSIRELTDPKGNKWDIIGWIHSTSVEGNQIELFVFND